MSPKDYIYNRYWKFWATWEEMEVQNLPMTAVVKLMDAFQKDELTAFVDFLLKEGYGDLDMLDNPTAIDKYLIPKLKKR